MAEEKHQDDPELARLRQKSARGALNILEALFQQPEFRKLIRKAFIKQSVEMSIFLGFFVVGLFTLFNALKSIYNIGVVGDVAVGVILILVGLVYVVRSLR